MFKQILLVSMLAVLTSGCSGVLSVGSSDYGCKGMPNGATCMSAKEVYSATEGDDYKTKLKQEQEGATEENKDVQGQTRVLIADGADNAPIPMRARNPLPIRSQAVVMRIAIDPWEDERGDLYVPGFIYTEVEARRWEIGQRSPAPANTLRPLTVVQPSSPKK